MAVLFLRLNNKPKQLGHTRQTLTKREKNLKTFQYTGRFEKLSEKIVEANNVFVSEFWRTNGCIVSASSQHHTSLSLAFYSKVTAAVWIYVFLLRFLRFDLHSVFTNFSLWRFRSDSSDAVPERRSSSNTSKQISVSYCSNKSSSSSLTNDDGDSSEKEIKSHSISFSAILRYNQMKLKVDFIFLYIFSLVVF